MEENCNLAGIPSDFIVRNLTHYQRYNMKLKYNIVKNIDNRDNITKEVVFCELSNNHNLTIEHIKRIYYSVK